MAPQQTSGIGKLLSAEAEKFRWDGGLTFLVAMNLVPLLGVIFADWSVFWVVALYWFENVLIGAVNVLRMLASGRGGPPAAHLAKLFFVPFFTVHYGGFCAGHGFFIGSIFNEALPRSISAVTAVPWLVLSLVAIAIPHFVRFVQNDLVKGNGPHLGTLMFLPYPRIVVLHVVVLFGAIGIQAMGSPMPMLVLLVLLKTAIDVISHFIGRWISMAREG